MVNKQCIQDNFQITNIGTILNKMTEANYLSTFDFTSSFNQLGLEESSQPLTAFSFDGNRYQWTRMVQGHKNSSSQFSRCMAQIFSNVPFSTSFLFYIDDCLLSSKNIDEHLKRLRFIFERLSWGNLKLSPTKTKLLQKEVTWLGYKLSSDGIRIEDNKVKAILSLPPPDTVKRIQKFLGAVNWQRNFIKGFAQMAAPLYDLLRKGVDFNWSKECQKSFEEIKTALTTSPILAIAEVSDPMQSYQVTIDSSKRGQGATLTQIINDQRRVIGYWSRSVPKHQQKYGATKLEFLCLHGALMHWKLLLHGTKLTVITDCAALLNLDTIFNRENAYMQRRLADLANFDFSIKHASGKSDEIQMADFLSRYAYETSNKEASTQTTIQHGRILHLNDSERSEPVTASEIKNEYNNDNNLSTVIEWVKSGHRPETFDFSSQPAELCYYYRKFEFLSFSDGILYRKMFNPNDAQISYLAIVVAYTLIERLLYMYHDTISNCHSGAAASVEQCKKQYFFYKMSHEFQLYTAACITCNKNKRPQKYLKAPLKTISYSHFGQGIAIDFLEPSKKATPRGNVALLTIVDLFSSYLVCVPVRSMDTKHTIRNIIHHWILKHGFPEAIHHDQGPSFTSELFKETLKVFGMKDKRTCPYSCQSNGAAEIQNFRINQAMRVTLSDSQWRDYDLWIGYIVFCLNSSISTRTGYSANFLAFGRELLMPRDLFIEKVNLHESRNANALKNSVEMEAYETFKNVRHIARNVTENSKKRAGYMTKQYDKKIKAHILKRGICVSYWSMPQNTNMRIVGLVPIE